MQTEAWMRTVVEGGGQRALATGHCAAVVGGILLYSSAHPYQQNGPQGATAPAADRDGGAPPGWRRCRSCGQDLHGSTSLPYYSFSGRSFAFPLSPTVRWEQFFCIVLFDK